MDEHLRRKVLKHPDRYPDEYLREASQGEDVLQADKERLEEQYRNTQTTREDVAEMILHNNQTRVAPHLQELYDRTNWLMTPWYKRLAARLRLWWEGLWGGEDDDG